jgi:hypothetical protein
MISFDTTGDPPTARAPDPRHPASPHTHFWALASNIAIVSPSLPTCRRGPARAEPALAVVVDLPAEANSAVAHGNAGPHPKYRCRPPEGVVTVKRGRDVPRQDSWPGADLRARADLALPPSPRPTRQAGEGSVAAAGPGSGPGGRSAARAGASGVGASEGVGDVPPRRPPGLCGPRAAAAP